MTNKQYINYNTTIRQKKFEGNKGKSETINRRRTVNTMDQRNRTKEQTMIYKVLHKKRE